jgi:hypothetical protein
VRKFLSMIDVGLGTLLFLSGFLHNLVIVQVVQQGASLEILWIITGGLLMNTLGALNLARVWHGQAGVALRWFCVYCNAAFLIWFLIFDLYFGAAFPYQAMIFTFVMACLTAFSIRSIRAPRTATVLAEAFR